MRLLSFQGLQKQVLAFPRCNGCMARPFSRNRHHGMLLGRRLKIGIGGTCMFDGSGRVGKYFGTLVATMGWKIRG